MEEKTIVRPGVSESAWRFMASLKLTVVLLLCLALLSIIGTVIPQNLGAQDYADRYGLFAYRLFVLLDIPDMYHSWWFLSLLVLLVINIVVCSVDRLQSTGKIIFTRKPKFDLQQYRNRKSRHIFAAGTSPGNLKEPLRRFLARRFRYCEVVATKNGFAITAEKGRWTRLGVYVVHLSIVVLLFGALIGAKYGFEGFVAIPEGETADTIRLNRTGETRTLPFAIHCNDFDLQFYEGTRRPKEYRSRLTIIDGGAEVLSRSVVVNDPLIYNGIGIYQSSYGRMEDPAPLSAEAFDPSQPVELVFRSAESGMIYTRKLTMGESVQLPEGLGMFELERYKPDAAFRGMELGPSLVGNLTNRAGEKLAVTLPLNYPKFDSMRGGAVTISVSRESIKIPETERYYTGLQVVYDPGVWVVYAGFILMIAGCAVAFFMSHQQVVVEVTAEGNKSRVLVSGKSNKNRVGFQMKLQRLTERLEAFAERGHGMTRPANE